MPAAKSELRSEQSVGAGLTARVRGPACGAAPFLGAEHDRCQPPLHDPTVLSRRVARLLGITRDRPGRVLHPLGPLVYRLEAPRPAPARLSAAVIFVGCAVLLAVAARLHPDGRGLGSHEQLGFPPCSFVVLFGRPCPTCGMTTAFAHAVRGELIAALRVQPAGLAAALATMVTACAALSVMVTGKVWMVNWYRVSPGWIVAGCVLLILGAWAYKLVCGLA